MALPIIAGIAIAAGAGAGGGGLFGSIFGKGIDEEKNRIESLVSDYEKQMEMIKNRISSFSSVSEVINSGQALKSSGMGFEDTYLTDLSKAFSSPKEFDIYPREEE